MEVAKAQEFIRQNHRAVLATTRRDGSPQLSPVLVGVDDDGFLLISTRETAMKTHNLRREPRVSLCVLTDTFYGGFVQVDGTTEIVSMPEALPYLRKLYQQAAGDHADWDDFDAAMERERRVALRIRIERAGPDRQG